MTIDMVSMVIPGYHLAISYKALSKLINFSDIFANQQKYQVFH